MSSTPFGDHLRREREMRGVSLAEISTATRIKTEYLEALENERWGALPGGAFNRGFIRSVARFLGMDEDSLVAEYALETKDNAEAAAKVRPRQDMPRDLKPLFAAIGLLLLLLVGVFVAFKLYRSRSIAKQKQSSGLFSGYVHNGQLSVIELARDGVIRAGAFD